MKLCRILALIVFTFASVEISMGQAEQRELIKPITKKLTIIYIPKVIHPWVRRRSRWSKLCRR